MRVFIKIVLSFVAFIFCGGMAKGCMDTARASGGPNIGGMFPLIILIGALIGIWKYNPEI